jgi:carboxyl-terminal processing protease
MKRVLFLAVVLGTVIAISQASSGVGDRSPHFIFRKAMSLIEEEYIEKPDTAQLYRNAITHMTERHPDEFPSETVAALLPSEDGPDDVRRYLAAMEQTLRMMRKELGRDKFDQTEAYRDAIEGMVNGLTMDGTPDHYSSFLRPKNRRQLQEQLRGSFQGVGILIEFKEGHLKVVRPIEGSPAAEAGIEEGDDIVAIDGRNLADIPVASAEDAAKVIRGERGTTVVLRIMREGVPEPLEFIVRRDRVKNVSNLRKEMLTDRVGYVSLRGFTQDSATDLSEAVKYLEVQGMEGLILDLRWNPGGLLDMAIAVSDLFLEPGELITYTQGRDIEDYHEYRSKDDPIFRGPMVVLVNKFSASASEIVAGALRDNSRAKLVGLRTFGKGSVQEIYRFPDDSALRLTIAKYYTPSGVSIHLTGIQPDREVALNLEETGEEVDEADRWKRDTQTVSAVETLIGEMGSPVTPESKVSDATVLENQL